MIVLCYTLFPWPFSPFSVGSKKNYPPLTQGMKAKSIPSPKTFFDPCTHKKTISPKKVVPMCACGLQVLLLSGNSLFIIHLFFFPDGRRPPPVVRPELRPEAGQRLLLHPARHVPARHPQRRRQLETGSRRSPERPQLGRRHSGTHSLSNQRPRPPAPRPRLQKTAGRPVRPRPFPSPSKNTDAEKNIPFPFSIPESCVSPLLLRAPPILSCAPPRKKNVRFPRQPRH